MFWYLAGMADSRSLSERLAKMPPGRHLVPRDFVTQSQRERMLLATTELVAERGFQKTTIELIAKTARVALSTFGVPMRSVPCSTCRCRLDASTVSLSITPIVPTPAAAK